MASSKKPPLPGQALTEKPSTSAGKVSVPLPGQGVSSRPPVPSGLTPPFPPAAQTATRPSSQAILAEALPVIKRFEGCRLKAYVCPAGVPTIGWGATKMNGKPIVMGMTITQAQADALLTEDATRFLQALLPLVRGVLHAKQYGALLSFVYNVGVGAFETSTLRGLLNAGKLAEAAAQFDRWTFANGKPLPGLVARRIAEKALFLAGMP
ncbi:MAG: lysozyme [Vampirovibrionales bacterium]